MRALLVAAAVVLAACPGRDGAVPVAGPEPVAPEPQPAAQPPPEPPPPPPESPPEPEVPRRDDGVVLVEGAPEVPDELKERLGPYLNTRSAEVADISEDGEAMLVLTRFGETTQLHRLEGPMRARRQLTFGDEPVEEARFVPGTDDEIVYIADVGGDEQYQIFHRDLESGNTTRITDGDSRNDGVVWHRDGAKMAFYSNRRNGVDFDIWISNGRDPGAARLLVETEGYWRPLDWSRDGKELLVKHHVSVTDQRLYIADTESGELEHLGAEGETAAYREAVFSRDGKRVFATTDRGGEFVGIHELERESGEWKSLTGDIPWDVEAMALTGGGRELAFSVNANGYSVLRILDTRTGKHQKAGGIPQGVIDEDDLRVARGTRAVLAFTHERPTHTADAYRYDARRGELTRWTNSEMGGLDQRALLEPELLHYRTFDGAKIPFFYYRPDGEGPFPVVVEIHGGPASQSRPGFSETTQYLAVERGIAVLYPNVRGSEGYGKTYVSLDDADKREDSVEDIGALLDWIEAQDELDADRVAVWGASYGGYMVLASLVHYSDRLVAGVDNVGISNFVTFLENTADYRRDLRRVEYGDERDPEMRKHLEAISPLNNVDKIQAALFVAQGANDPRVPASEAEQIVSAVRDAGHDVWYMLARNEGHGFSKKENRDLYLQLSLLFLERHLLDRDG